MAENNILSALHRHHELEIDAQIDYDKFYLYSIITHSTAIEGSTVTEVENQLLFDEGISPAGRPLVEQLMNLDLRDAYLKWLSWAGGAASLPRESHPRFTPEILCKMVASVMRRTGSVYHTMLGDFDSSQGEIRKVNVRAGANGRSYMAFQKVPSKLKEFCNWLNESLSRIDANDAVAIYRLSFSAHYRLVTIHPWVDGKIASKREQTSLLDLPSVSNLDEVNGRTTRLLMNILQSHFGLPMSKVMKQDKAEYIQALIDAREAEDESIFIDKMLALHCADLEKQIKDFEEDTNIADIQKENVNVIKDVIKKPDHVIKDVIKELTERQKIIVKILIGEPACTVDDLADRLGVTWRTIMRDIEKLKKLNVVTREGGRAEGRWVVKIGQHTTSQG